MEPIDLSLTERLILANQFQILAALKPSEADDYNHLVEIAKRGFALEYPSFFTDFDREGLTREQCEYVRDVLDMFWNLQDSYDQLANKGTLKESDVIFPGFDGNNENSLLQYAKLQLQHGFQEFRHKAGLNSHFPTAHEYPAMLKRYEAVPIERRRQLSADEMRKILGR